MRKVKLSFTEDDAFVPKKGDPFNYEGHTYYIHDFKEDEQGHDIYDVYHLTLAYHPVENNR